MEEKLNSIAKELANYQLNDLKRHAEVLEQLKEHKYEIDDMYKKLSEESERLSMLSKKLYDYMDVTRAKLSLIEYSLKKNELPPRKRWRFF